MNIQSAHTPLQMPLASSKHTLLKTAPTISAAQQATIDEMVTEKPGAPQKPLLSAMDSREMLSRLRPQSSTSSSAQLAATAQTLSPGQLAGPAASPEAIAEVSAKLASLSKITGDDLLASLRALNIPAEVIESLDADESHLTAEAAANSKGKPMPPNPYKITLEGLLANWGESDSVYDLTGNGTVGVQDLLVLLSNGGTMYVGMPEDYEMTLEGLLDAWGKSDSQYDLNGDGTVGVQDLLMFLQGKW